MLSPQPDGSNSQISEGQGVETIMFRPLPQLVLKLTPYPLVLRRQSDLGYSRISGPRHPFARTELLLPVPLRCKSA